jgi:hypothetical protein
MPLSVFVDYIVACCNRCRCCVPKFPIQSSLNRKYMGPDLTIGDNTANIINTAFVCLLYSTGMPLLYFFASMSFLLMYSANLWGLSNLYRCRTPQPNPLLSSSRLFSPFFSSSLFFSPPCPPCSWLSGLYRKPAHFGPELNQLVADAMFWGIWSHSAFAIWTISSPILGDLSTASSIFYHDFVTATVGGNAQDSFVGFLDDYAGSLNIVDRLTVGVLPSICAFLFLTVYKIVRVFACFPSGNEDKLLEGEKIFLSYSEQKKVAPLESYHLHKVDAYADAFIRTKSNNQLLAPEPIHPSTEDGEVERVPSEKNAVTESPAFTHLATESRYDGVYKMQQEYDGETHYMPGAV